jgi:hypothetical protein
MAISAVEQNVTLAKDYDGSESHLFTHYVDSNPIVHKI